MSSAERKTHQDAIIVRLLPNACRTASKHSSVRRRVALFARWLGTALIVCGLLVEGLAPLAAAASRSSAGAANTVYTEEKGASMRADMVRDEVEGLGASPAVQARAENAASGLETLPSQPLFPNMSQGTELVERRTASGAIFHQGDREYTAVVSAQPLHYQDDTGAWQAIDPAFRSLGDSFAVQHNDIQSRAGLYTAWLSAVAGQTAVLWEAQSLGAVDDSLNASDKTGANRDDGFVLLAKAIDEPAQTAQLGADGRMLRYTANWSASYLREEFHSAPGSLEHVLVLDEPPQWPARHDNGEISLISRSTSKPTPDHLELRAELQLLPGATLWADGESRTSTFRTAGELEIRDAAGETTMVFAPVVAFEEAQPHVRVAGEYSLQPGSKPGVWMVGVRTPWRWWLDPSRQYPAVIDPIIKVNRSTGYGEGIAWIGNGGGWNHNSIVLGPYDGANSEAEGYVQFNSFPGLLSNAPIQIKQAWLDVEPNGITMPFYSHPKGDFPDWEHEKIQRTTQLYYVGSCPMQGSCANLALQDSAPANTWGNRPQGNPVAAGAQKELVAGPAKGAGDTTVTTWEVTQELRDWYDQWYTHQDRPKPIFRLRFPHVCNVAGPYEGVKSAYIPLCSYFHIGAGNVRLRIEYEELPLAAGDNLLNMPGVPGYQDGVLEDTAHQYDLAITAGFSHWRGVAVRGDHNFQPGPVTRAGVKIVDETSGDPQLLTTAATPNADKTAFVLIDDHNAGGFIATADLKALVTASNENNLPSDPDRNYRIEYQQAQEHTVPIGDWYKINIAMDSERLLDLHEFHFDYGDKVAVRAVISPAVDIALVEPTSGSQKKDAVVGNNDSRVNRGFQPTDSMTRTLSAFAVARTGVWALGVINQSRPIPGAFAGPPLDFYMGYVEILRCPQGTIPTAKWKCQPLRLPDDTVPQSRDVDNLSVYSEGGFLDLQGGGWCTTNEGSGAPVIGPDQSERWAFVGQGSLCFDDDTGQLYTTPDSGVGLAVPIASTPSTDKRGDFYPTFVFGDTSFSPVLDGVPDGEVVIENDRVDVKDEETRINIRPFAEHWQEAYMGDPTYMDLSDMTARSGGLLSTQISLGSDAQPFDIDFDAGWNLFPNPDPGGETAAPLYTFNTQILQNSQLPIPMDLASLSVRIMQDGSDIPDGRIKKLDSYLKSSGPSAGNLRADSARVTQDAQLGGATKPAKVVLQPPGLPRLPDNEKSCHWQGNGTSCLDLRVPEYQWANGDGEKAVARWELPDIHLTDEMATMMVSSAGQLSIFSVDHPNATNVSQSFSFDTWDATVSVTQEPCGEGEPETVVVRGMANIAMPNVGDDGSAPPSIEVSFKLCETQLRQAKLVFSIPAPGIPVGSTGVGVNLIGGTVTVGPESTTITIEIGFQTMDGTTLKNGKGVVTIDTAGLFSLQASGKIVSVLDAQLLLQVAWNPLDLLFEAEVGYKGIIEGGLRMHAWIGQGWQGKYSWLPDNDDFHFTGTIWATLNIEAGMVVDEGIFKLPPFSFSLTITISFGEFCTNPSCTTYDWGMSATLTVLGYAVGMYVDSSGPELILGTDNHKLIDQFGGSVLMAAESAATPPVQAAAPDILVIQPGNLQLLLKPIIETPVDNWPKETAADECTGVNGSVHTCPFTVNPGTGRALFSASWENGLLDVVLLKPDNTVINAGNAIAHGAVYSNTNDGLLHHVSFAVSAPAGQSLMAGEWKLQLSNVGVDLPPGFDNNYCLLFASDPPEPVLQWNTPATAGVTPDGNGMANLSWNATRDGQPLAPDVRLELFYTPAASKPVTPTLMDGNMLANGVSAVQGNYQWDTRGLASGEYAVGARIDDRRQGNGHVVAWAPGTIVVNDTTPPPVPEIVGQLPLDDALLVAWKRDDVTPDLAGYLVEYTIPDWDFGAPQLQKVRRMIPRSKFQFPLFERVRLGGLLSGLPTTVCVRAYDASGNVSGCEEFTLTIPSRPGDCRLGELTGLEAGRTGPGEGTVVWDVPDCGDPDGYLLDYRPVGCFVPGLDRSTEESPPVVVVDDSSQFQYVLRGLTDYQTYWVGMRAYTNQGDLSPQSTTTLHMFDPTDANADGLADGWAALYGVSDPNGDPDGDGLTNKEEQDLGTDPNHADSDLDGFYDGEEKDWGTDACGPETPPYHMGPKLQVSGLSSASFVAATNFTPLKKQKLQIFNSGAGELHWTAVISGSWILVNKTSGIGPDVLEIEVDPAGLAPGVYESAVSIHTEAEATAAATAAEFDEEVTIPVRLEVLPPKTEDPEPPLLQQLFLPQISG